MRLGAVLLFAIPALLSDTTGTRLAADPKPYPITAGGVIFELVPEDTRCPAATHIIKSCNNDPGTFLVFDNTDMRHNNLPDGYCTIRGDEDFEACPPYRLVHVRFIGKLPHGVYPLPCEPPAYP
jgi:hypothetical protein